MEPAEIYISFAKNGDDLGVCFPVQKSDLEEEALFPHILTKNVAFECNFGASVSSLWSIHLKDLDLFYCMRM